MSDQQRRIYGFIIGLAFGLPYSIIVQFINVWALPDVPLYDLPIGRIASVILTTLAMGITGLAVAWEEESFFGIIGSSLFLVIASSVLAFVNTGSSQVVPSFFLFLFTFLPRLIIYLPLAFSFRWLLGILEANSRGSGLIRLLKVTGVILVLAIIGGRFSLLAPEAHQALRDMNGLVLQGTSSVANGDEVPIPFIPVDGFTTYAKGEYTLEWSSDVDSLPVTRPIAEFGVTESLIIVRFENNYQFGCVFTPPSPTAKCINITRVR